MTLRKALSVLAVGAAGTLVAAWSLPGSAHAALVLAGKAAASSALVGVVGSLALMLLAKRPLSTQMTLVTLTTVGAVGAGALADRGSNYVGDDALAALAVMLFSSGTIGALVGLYLGHRVAEGSAELAAAARRIGQGESNVHVAAPPTEELATLARELERSSQQLAASHARAAALETSRRELVAWVSHDLRTPLSRIRVIVEALEDGIVSDPAEIADYHGRLRLEADRLSRLVDSLFELSRIASGSIELELRPISLGDLVSDLVAAFSPIAEAGEVVLHANLHGVSPIVSASMEHVERALSNLLDNAIRYTTRGSSIDIDVGRRDDHAYFAVSDRCGGLTADELERLFETRLPSGHARRPSSGTGLGLPIAKGLIEAHTGTITAENTTRGCRFVVTLPLHLDPAARTSIDSDAPEGSRL